MSSQIKLNELSGGRWKLGVVFHNDLGAIVAIAAKVIFGSFKAAIVESMALRWLWSLWLTMAT